MGALIVSILRMCDMRNAYGDDALRNVNPQLAPAATEPMTELLINLLSIASICHNSLSLAPQHINM